MRDKNWLDSQLQYLLRNYFSDVKITNPIEIRFGREAKYRFGSIRLIRAGRSKRQRAGGKFSIFKSQLSISRIPQKSIITITSLFAKETVPADVVRYTIGHELCHFAHGFSSQNRRMFKYPHHGGIVNKELKERGAEDLILAFKKWLKIYRKKILAGKINV
ncbi:hypothetical protein A3D07_02680 [Candidatus Curtissbacteria bacterium RIFCSPHIGHO2_02_FULL_42_15]|uniref:SprT-like domain-containing protein n=1 Tax=Candidatus Curtissbacteria bacterium RIFCSPHIGHO2_02_FULL_42_15 TaxID=1797716 RepID=A0A1F5GIW1_9BACT|nr:MAG: hypothetical protein A3D07_02680 [Candidatus Curtissbacteria bacterium RIFCSPHIGHO2_02_FULL_42_15]